MTRTEMLSKIEELRGQGHTVGNLGHVGDWKCEIDEVTGRGTTPMEAFEAALQCLLALEAAKGRTENG